ncbi:MAG TPA: nuclear transport factor 2 family protein [Sporichthyaceae bacterium]|jgi:ketosteroid isomerase-like protein|nr:nuclear transport factor 2 family protein [Sporichthyaceae bacterium]
MITELTDLHPTWAARFNARDLDGMLALCEEGAAFVPQPGTVLTAAGDVRAALRQFLALNLPIHVEVRHSIEAGDVGLVVADWVISGAGPDGSPVDLRGSASDVARRGSDGWKIAIDNPFGTA